MTREEAKVLLPIIQAFSEGRKIMIKNRRLSNEEYNWSKVDDCSFNIKQFEYSIKPKSTYRPFKNVEECWQEMQKHQPFGWVKWNDVRYNIYEVSSISVCLINGNCENMDFAYAYQKLTFDDGLPFGVKVEE